MMAYLLSELRFDYGRKTVLNIDHLAIPAGTITALIGPNGSGKSTLLGLLAFLLQPTTGELRFFGQTINRRNLLASRRRVGLVSQNPYLLRGTVLDNVALSLKLRGIALSDRRQRAHRALEQVGLASFAGKVACQLSGGEMQKVALARTLVMEPDLLLFDEPFSYLDQSSIALIESVIRSYNSQAERTVIFTTHDRLHGIALADQVVALVGGKPVEAPLINLFTGAIRNGCFESGSIRIVVPGKSAAGELSNAQHAAIDSDAIVVSREPLLSSLRNSYPGRLTSIVEEGDRVRLTVDAGELFQLIITYQSLNELKLQLGDSVWISFKSTSVRFF